MITDLRRSKRHNDFLAVHIIAKNGLNGDKEAGPFSGRVINISRHGACLLMSLGTLESYKVYSATHKDDSSFIEIQGTIGEDMVSFNLPARPIWMEPVIIDEIRAFNMGVEFMVNPFGDQMEDIIDAVTIL